MTTFTTDDREEEYKKILAEAPNQPGYEDAVPIYSQEDIKALEKGLEFYKQLKGDNTSPPHIVDSGASVMIKPVAYINVEERKLEWAGPVEWGTPTIAKMDKVPLYLHPVKELTDGEILNMYLEQTNGNNDLDILKFAEAILRKAQEK